MRIFQRMRNFVCHLALLSLGLVWVPAWADPVTAVEEEVGIEIPNAKAPMQGVLTGGQPTEADLGKAAAAGYRTIVNLRGVEESISFDEKAVVNALGMEYIAIPIADSQGLTVDKARRLAEILARPKGRPLMIHCASGNRVGALMALKAFHLDGKDLEAALNIGRQAGLTRLEAAVREVLTGDVSKAE